MILSDVFFSYLYFLKEMKSDKNYFQKYALILITLLTWIYRKEQAGVAR